MLQPSTAQLGAPYRSQYRAGPRACVSTGHRVGRAQGDRHLERICARAVVHDAVPSLSVCTLPYVSTALRVAPYPPTVPDILWGGRRSEQQTLALYQRTCSGRGIDFWYRIWRRTVVGA
eukprot:3706645-Rhodomonas_salina.2